MTLVVASLVERDVAGVTDSSKAAFRQGADMVECRLDHLSNLSQGLVREVRREVLGPAIATLRSKKEGGRSSLGPEKREALLRTALEENFEYVDFELRSDRRLLRELVSEEWESQKIASSHLPRPASRQAVERRLREGQELADIAKVAMRCEDASDGLMLCEIGMRFAQRRKRFALIGMGPQGQVTRAFSDKIGSHLTYSSLHGTEAAPGQLEISVQSELLNHPRTVLGLVGHPVSHSVSKPMQEAALGAIGRAGTYLPLDFRPGRFTRRSLRTMRELGFEGLNVTIPHKRTAYELCDSVGPAAEATGAVNTITFSGKAFVGENTDVNGFARSIDGKMYITPGIKVLVVGAGGVARAIAYMLSERAAALSIVDIEKKRAEKLARTFGARAFSISRLFKSGKTFDLVVNCSPVGMKGSPGNPIRKSLFREGSVFFDVVYNPQVTAAMKTAESAGAMVFGGLEMLVQQGAESFRLWTGREPDVDAMRAAARRALE